jgi:hypothetical protein
VGNVLLQFKEYLERAEYIKKEFIDAQTAEVSATVNGAAAQKPKAGGGGGKDEVSQQRTHPIQERNHGV